jgi:hypothetical protein
MRRLFITLHHRFTIARPMSVITDRRRYTGVTTTGYVIIVIAAVAIDHTIKAVACPIKFVPTAFASAYDSRSSPCRAGFPACRQACSTSTRKGCCSILAINKTSHCFSGRPRRYRCPRSPCLVYARPRSRRAHPLLIYKIFLLGQIQQNPLMCNRRYRRRCSTCSDVSS